MDFVRSLPKAATSSGGDSSFGSFGAIGAVGRPVVGATAAAARGSQIPPYGQRKKWVPRTPQDFGDGGAFPEIHVAQYPLNMGRNAQQGGKTVPLQYKADGTIDYGAIGEKGNQLTIFSGLDSMKEKWSRPEDLVKPDANVNDINTQRTMLALQKVQTEKTAKGMVHSKDLKTDFVRYTPNVDAPGYNPDAAVRVIKVAERQIDPLEPPKFKHKKVPKGPGTPPPPVNRSPPRKLTQEDQKMWKIPPAISNWKNSKGYVIPLDKRIAADGRQLQDVTLSDKFAGLNEDLLIAELKAREAIKLRNDLAKQRKIAEADDQEANLRDIAMQSRQAASSIGTSKAREGETEEEAKERQYRDQVLRDRKREIERDKRLEMAGKKGKKRDREEDRDVSEKIALGQVAAPTKQHAMYDQRLFNQSAGMDSGFGAEDKNDIYDTALFEAKGTSFYKFDKDRTEEMKKKIGNVLGDEGNDDGIYNVQDSGPVEFERAEDPFGVDRAAKRQKKD